MVVLFWLLPFSPPKETQRDEGSGFFASLRMTGETMKRKVIALILAGVLAFGLIGCGKETKDTGLNNAETEQSVSIEKAPKE